MPLRALPRPEPEVKLGSAASFHVMLVVFQHFLLLPTAIGFGIGVVVGHPAIGLVAGLVVGCIYAGFMAFVLGRALTEGATTPPPPGGWRTWDDDDDWDS